MGLGTSLESISAFFPAYNDASTIGGLVEKVIAVLRDTGQEFEVIVVDDGSTDDTARTLREMQARYPGVLRIVRHSVNRGYGGALRSGFEAATKDLVFYTDGDGQYDPSELALLLGRLEPGLGLINGYKIKRHDPFHRIMIGKIYNLFVRLLFRIRVKDVDCDFRLIRREYLTLARLESNTGAICVELLRELEGLGCKSADVPVHHYPRLSGQSQFFRWRSVWSTIQQLTALYFRPRPTVQPARELWGPNAK